MPAGGIYLCVLRKLTVIVESKFYKCMLNDFCPFSLWTDAATTIVNGEQKSLMDSAVWFGSLLFVMFLLQNILDGASLYIV